MEPSPVLKEKFFIVIRGKSRKGFSRGCIGREEAETHGGELMGLLYCGGSNAGSPKKGGVVRREDTYPLTRYQAQLLLFVSSVSKRLELLCNPQLFSAICELTVDDLVVVKSKKGHKPGLVKNLMRVGKKESKDDLQMLAFEVEFVDSDQTLSSKKPAPPTLFSAADIIQVVPSYSVPLGLNWGDGQYHGTNKRTVARINSMPNIGANGRVKATHTQQSVIPSQSHSTSRAPLEVGSLVEVVSNTGVTVYGVLRWLGIPGGKTAEWAGIELDYDVNGCSDGIYGGQRLFTCKKSRALFVPVTKCSPDSRFACSSTASDTTSQIQIPTDPEEFITVLFQKVLGIEPLLKLRSRGESYQGAYTFQIFLEKEQMAHIPTVQQLMDASCLSCDVKFEEMPSCLIVQMPRFGNKYKMFSHIIPSMELDLTDLLHNSPRQCFICGQLAAHECLQCLPDHKLHQGRIKQYCGTCNTQVHTHPSRQGHSPKPLSVPAEVATASPAPGHTMQLFAVLCIHTSHYVSFVKFGSDPHSWLFFDSMADRCGDDQRGFSIPEIRACPELGNFLSQSEEEQARTDPSYAPALVRRLLCDSYMFLYQNPTMPVSNSNYQDP
ncbi:ubiquitin carboxyl-terminal hydrolase CYLD isoform X3 [Dunckerocampus dactyliophorus]|uniref:ubiquitin carboxyl-terminal hydrolase CYLD isoform X3 n=1 Tax=Dunckerocampus dactyliophorus TaxID=161453 RepID=UPI002405E52B|nr:ubiquitin carboxyl-terminal hydrolase CYLD isoform X3 [Dunckerocampus dactyliophorus]